MEISIFDPLSSTGDYKEFLRGLCFRLAKTPRDVEIMKCIFTEYGELKNDQLPRAYNVYGSDCATAWFMFLVEQLLRHDEGMHDPAVLLIGKSEFGTTFQHYSREIQEAGKKNSWVFVVEDDEQWLYGDGKWFHRGTGIGTCKNTNVGEIHLIDEHMAYGIPGNANTKLTVEWKPSYVRCLELYRLRAGGRSTLVYSGNGRIIIVDEPAQSRQSVKVGSDTVHYYGQPLSKPAHGTYAAHSTLIQKYPSSVTLS
jgi:hypothetical protein